MNKGKTIIVVIIIGIGLFFATEEREKEEVVNGYYIEITEEDIVDGYFGGNMQSEWEAPKDFEVDTENGQDLQLIFAETKKEIESYIEQTKQIKDINNDATDLMEKHYERMNLLWNRLYELNPAEKTEESIFIIETSFWYQNYVNQAQSLFTLLQTIESEEQLLEMGFFPEEFNSLDGIMRYPFRFSAQRYNELISRFYNQYSQVPQPGGAMRIE